MRKHQVRCRHCILGTRYFLRAYPGRPNAMPTRRGSQGRFRMQGRLGIRVLLSVRPSEKQQDNKKPQNDGYCHHESSCAFFARNHIVLVGCTEQGCGGYTSRIEAKCELRSCSAPGCLVWVTTLPFLRRQPPPTLLTALEEPRVT